MWMDRYSWILFWWASVNNVSSSIGTFATNWNYANDRITAATWWYDDDDSGYDDKYSKEWWNIDQEKEEETKSFSVSYIS